MLTDDSGMQSRLMHLRRAARGLTLLVALLMIAPGVWALDHSYAAWGEVLSRHVRWDGSGTSSTVDYRGIQAEQDKLRQVLAEFSAVPKAVYEHFGRDQKLAFLINAYNAFTVDLILSKYPRLESIKDLGSLFANPWKKKFFLLLGAERTLDDIEHGMIRAPGAFDEPRIHFAVVCASVGCPALRSEPWQAGRLESQLQDSALRFLSDRTRNRYDPKTRTVQVSMLFDWYGEDFEKGHQGVRSVAGFLARFATQLANGKEAIALIQAGKIPVEFLDYDWSLNDRR